MGKTIRKHPIMKIRKQTVDPGYIIGNYKYCKKDRRHNKEELNRELSMLEQEALEIEEDFN